MDKNMITRGRCLVDLIAGITPTLVDWTVDPTDAADITDGDITTFCTTGNNVIAGGWDYAYFEWDLGAIYNVICSGVLANSVTAGSGRCFLSFWDGANWRTGTNDFVYGANIAHGFVTGGMCSKIRLGITSDAAATVTPNIREFHVWRL